jgi:hypothetical protein
MQDSYPYDWIQTLDNAEKLDFEYVISGHSDVLHGKGTFELWKQYLSDVMAETAKVYVEGGTLDDARKRVAPVLLSKYAGKFGRFDPHPPHPFAHDVIPNIEKAYRVVSGQLQ